MVGGVGVCTGRRIFHASIEPVSRKSVAIKLGSFGSDATDSSPGEI
jgi:hypothetical protein